MSTDRWAAWDAMRAAGTLPTQVARGLSDDDLTELLGAPGAGRDEERKLLATEALRRLTDARQALNARTLPPAPEESRHREVVNRASERVHQAEEKLERQADRPSAAGPLRAAHEASRLAEEHRAGVETGIEQHAQLHEHVERTRSLRRQREDKDEGS